MNGPGPLDTATRVLRDAHSPPTPEPPSEAARAATIAALERALRARAARRSARRRLAWIGSVAAAALVGAFGLQHWLGAHHGGRSGSEVAITATGRVLGGTVTAERGGARVRFDGAALENGDRVRTEGAGRAEIALSNGTSVVLSAKGDVQYQNVPHLRAFKLAAGSVEAHVAKLGSGERFLVQTADAEVEVRGTVFSVSLAEPHAECGDATPTRVHVTEGVVVVRQGGKEARVAAGESWPSGCGEAVATGAAPAPLSPAASAPLASASSIAASAPAPSVALAAARPSGGVAASTSAGSPASTLGAENDLITLALDARKRERYEEALSLCERYLATYPSGAHVDDARDIAKTARERIAHAAPSESASPKP